MRKYEYAVILCIPKRKIGIRKQLKNLTNGYGVEDDTQLSQKKIQERKPNNMKEHW